MSRKDTIEEKAWELLLKVCSEQGIIPVDAEYAKTGGEYNLLMYIDKEGGVGIDECEACSRALDPLLLWNRYSICTRETGAVIWMRGCSAFFRAFHT